MCLIVVRAEHVCGAWRLGARKSSIRPVDGEEHGLRVREVYDE